MAVRRPEIGQWLSCRKDRDGRIWFFGAQHPTDKIIMAVGLELAFSEPVRYLGVDGEARAKIAPLTAFLEVKDEFLVFRFSDGEVILLEEFEPTETMRVKVVSNTPRVRQQ